MGTQAASPGSLTCEFHVAKAIKMSWVVFTLIAALATASQITDHEFSEVQSSVGETVATLPDELMVTKVADHDVDHECNPSKGCTCKKCCASWMNTQSCAGCVKTECPAPSQPECNPSKGCTCKKCCASWMDTRSCASCVKHHKCSGNRPQPPTPGTPEEHPVVVKGNQPCGPYWRMDPDIERNQDGLPASCKGGTICSDEESRTRCCFRGPIAGSVMPSRCEDLKCKTWQKCPTPMEENTIKELSTKEKIQKSYRKGEQA